jgi:S-(hydroxymethyl)glutathione dehydrogenase/alcohol dehydrogenase
MQAAVLHEPNTPLVIEDVDLEAPRAGEARVRITATGLCHTDLHGIRGHRAQSLPIILGHEGAGVVEAVGPSVADLRPGDHVIFSFRPNCGRCANCARGVTVLCSGRPADRQLMIDGTSRVSLRGQPLFVFARLGTFAEQVVVPAEQAIPVRQDVPQEVAALIGCSVTTGVCAVTNAANVQPGDRVAVFGCGGVGLNVIQGARLVSAGQIIAVDLLDAKLALAREFGATHTVNAGRQDAVAAVRELSGGGVDVAFEAIGLPLTVEQALECVRPGGMAVVAGIPPRGSRPSFEASELVLQQKTLKGTSSGSAQPRVDIPRMVDLYQSGTLRLDELVSRRYRLEEINLGFEPLEQGEMTRGADVFLQSA